MANNPAPGRRYHGIVMLRRTIPNDAKKTKSCPRLAAIYFAQQNVKTCQLSGDKLTYFDGGENLFSDSELVEDEFSAWPLSFATN